MMFGKDKKNSCSYRFFGSLSIGKDEEIFEN